jgi:hypothetical protein
MHGYFPMAPFMISIMLTCSLCVPRRAFFQAHNRCCACRAMTLQINNVKCVFSERQQQHGRICRLKVVDAAGGSDSVRANPKVPEHVGLSRPLARSSVPSLTGIAESNFVPQLRKEAGCTRHSSQKCFVVGSLPPQVPQARTGQGWQMQPVIELKHKALYRPEQTCPSSGSQTPRLPS